MNSQNLPDQYHHELMPTTSYYLTKEEEKEEEVDYEKMNESQKFDLFKNELQRMGITDTWKWKDANRVIQDSKHYSVLPTIKQKKQAFNEYIDDFTAKINKSKRENRKKQIDEFYEMLNQIHEIRVHTKYIEALKYIQFDRRFIELDEKDREEKFQHYMDDLERKELKRKQEHERRKVESIKKLFSSHDVPTTMKFTEAEEQFKNNGLFTAVDKIIQLMAFKDYISEKIEEEDKIEYQKKIRRERKNREAFRELMEELIRDK